MIKNPKREPFDFFLPKISNQKQRPSKGGNANL